MNRNLKYALAALGLCALTLNACALSGGPIDGVVVDETTGKPVADAIVVVHWLGRWTKIVGESSSGCYHVETARSDANGKFHIGRWQQSWSFSDLRLTADGMDWLAYKPGYWRGRSGAARPDTLYIAPLDETKDSYFKTVLESPAWGCSGAGASGKNEFRLFNAMAQEAELLAETPKQKGRVWMLRRLAEESLVNFDKPTHLVGDRAENVDPRDGFKKEEVPQ